MLKKQDKGGTCLAICEKKRISYWTICWKWIFPYPCKKEKEVEFCCYNFDWIKYEGRILFRCYWQGCEKGVLYKWTTFCIGSGPPYVPPGPTTKCFQYRLKEAGACSIIDIP